jgi:hypothetical protein
MTGITKFYKLWPKIYYLGYYAVMGISTVPCDYFMSFRLWEVLPCIYIYISLCCCVSLTLVSHSQLPLSPQWHNHRKNDTKDLGAKTSPTNRMNIGKMFQKKFPFSSFVWAPLNHREDLEQMTTKRMTEGIFVLRSLLLTPQIIFGIQLTYFHGKKYEVNLYALERL